MGAESWQPWPSSDQVLTPFILITLGQGLGHGGGEGLVVPSRESAKSPHLVPPALTVPSERGGGPSESKQFMNPAGSLTSRAASDLGLILGRGGPRHRPSL